jgi:hypothetical protein
LQGKKDISLKLAQPWGLSFISRSKFHVASFMSLLWQAVPRAILGDSLGAERTLVVNVILVLLVNDNGKLATAKERVQ